MSSDHEVDLKLYFEQGLIVNEIEFFYTTASWWWGKWSLDCGLLAFAFNFLCFVVFLVVLWVWFLNLGGVSFKLISKWGRAPDAPIEQVQIIAQDEVIF